MNQTSRKATAVAETISRNAGFLIAGHVKPDGDSLGCMCALGLGLRSLGKRVTMLSPEGVPGIYAFLPGTDGIVTSLPEGDASEVAVIVDCEGPDRLGDARDAVLRCSAVVRIDHHPGGDLDAPLSLVDTESASTAEVLLTVLRAVGVKTTPEIATCLLTAIVTDTGSFRFSNVRAATLRTAADLVEAGASLHEIAYHVYDTRTYSSVRLLGLVLSTVRTASDGRIAYARVTREHLAAAQAADADTEGIVNYVKGVLGADVGLLFREAPDNTIRVSLRCRDGLDVSRVARMFGGGGHTVAAGCTIETPLDEAERLVIGAVRACMGF
ncbi:MAG: bifunctional oligoribonuclease/PAP phosphatase NrnA [Armatimonadetes bacterium]|nr:bifunctional oligoribonuclease/PAP phosphatase NrnA [Armatimonadota bacterium]